MAKRPFNILSTKFLKREVITAARENGFRIVQMPFIETTLIEDIDLGNRMKTLRDKEVGAIFTSSSALNAVKSYLPEPPFWKIFCINGATLEAVRNYFPRESVIFSAPDAGQLSELIKENPVDKELWYFCGNRRLNIIPEVLDRAGINWKEMMVYATTLLQHKVEENFDGILFFSPSAVESFFGNNVLETHTTCFAFGPSTFKKLKEMTTNTIILNKDPDQFSMIAEINKHFKK